MFHCKTLKCPKIFGKITQDHCHTILVMLFKQNVAIGASWSTPGVRLFIIQSNTYILSGDSFRQKVVFDTASRVLCLQCNERDDN